MTTAIRVGGVVGFLVRKLVGLVLGEDVVEIYAEVLAPADETWFRVAASPAYRMNAQRFGWCACATPEHLGHGDLRGTFCVRCGRVIAPERLASARLVRSDRP